MYFPNYAFVLLSALLIIHGAEGLTQKRALQPLPFFTNDRWIIDSNQNHVPYVGINWPGAADTMLPEGLQYSSIQNIVQKISETGFNAVRLTFAVEMVDDILDNGGDVTIQETLTRALGEGNGTVVLGEILEWNPSFGANTTRLQVQFFAYFKKMHLRLLRLISNRFSMQWLQN